ncbi:cytochrome P450 [Luedemannella flava]
MARGRAGAPGDRARRHRRWVVTRYADVRAALADPRLSLDKANSTGGYRGLRLPPALDANLLNLDDPDHGRLRRLVAGAFSVRRVEALRPGIRATAGELVDAFAGPVDLMAAYAVPLPLTVIGMLLGVPVGELADFRSWTNALIAPDPARPDLARAAVASLTAYLGMLIDRKRASPDDDLVSAMIAARDADGDRLTEDELTSLAFVTIWAGYETTVHLLGNAVLTLLRHPDQLAAVRADPARLPAVVDEVVRHRGPLSYAIRRFPTTDVTIGGVRVPAGDTVLLCLAAAHRDPDRYGAPDLFDPARDDGGHVGFGHGPHYCLGAALARAEVEIALEVLVRRLPALTLAGEPTWLPSFRAHGLRTLPVTVDLA